MPVFGRDSEIVAVVAIRGPHVQLTQKKLMSLAPDVKKTAVQISRILERSSTKLSSE